MFALAMTVSLSLHERDLTASSSSTRASASELRASATVFDRRSMITSPPL